MFRRTLLRLTLQYSVLLLLLFTLFSGAVYEYMEYTFGGDYRGSNSSLVISGSEDRLQASEVADAGLDRLRNGLIVSYLVLLVIVPLISYTLAKRSLKPIQKSYEAQQRFVDDASHELRTPLSIIQGELELAVRKKRSVNEYHSAIVASLEEINGLNKLVANLLLITRGTHDDVKDIFKTFDLSTIAEIVAEQCQNVYADKQLNFTVKIKPCKVMGSPELLKRCLLNIVDNACKFSGYRGSVDITLNVQSNQAKFMVVDEGIGMTASERAQATVRFWRAESARSSKGHGLGLALAQQIVELHNGSLSLHSTPRKGTRVAITIPLTA